MSIYQKKNATLSTKHPLFGMGKQTPGFKAIGGGYNKQEFKTIEAVLKGGAKLNACETAEVKTKQTNKQKTHCIS